MAPPNTEISAKSSSRANSATPVRAVASRELKESTTKIYKVLADRLQRKLVNQLMDGPEDIVQVTPLEIVNHWLGKQSGVKASTFYLTRSALLWKFETDREFGWQAACDLLRRHKPTNPDNPNKQVDHGSAARRTRTPGRMIPERHLHKLIDELLGYGRTGHQTQWFLFAGIASGARPIEWTSAKWIDDQNGILRIYTAKSKNRNAWDKIPAMTFTAEDMDAEMQDAMTASKTLNGENSWYALDFSRRLSAINLTDEDLRVLNASRYLNGVALFRDVKIDERYLIYVRQHMRSVADVIKAKQQQQASRPESEQLSEEEIFAKFYYERIRHCIWRASQSAFAGQEIYSLVDTRSTFAANRKGMLGLNTAAKEMGHTGKFSARDYYAPASKAWDRYKPVHGNTKSQNQVDEQGSANSPAQHGGSAHGHGQESLENL